MNEQKVLSALHQSWTINSSKQWTPENPALGQCNVTALVLQDQFGGDILKTQVDSSWHFYNRIHNVIYDFTDSQFQTDISYDNQFATREEALAGIPLEEYQHLSKLFDKVWTT